MDEYQEFSSSLVGPSTLDDNGILSDEDFDFDSDSDFDDDDGSRTGRERDGKRGYGAKDGGIMAATTAYTMGTYLSPGDAKKGRRKGRKGKKKKRSDSNLSFTHEHVPTNELFEGEAVMATVNNVSFRWSYPGLRRTTMRGRLFVTSFRLLFLSNCSVVPPGHHGVYMNNDMTEKVSVPYMTIYRMAKRGVEYSLVQITIQTIEFKYVKIALDRVSAGLVNKFIRLFVELKNVKDLFAFNYRVTAPLTPYLYPRYILPGQFALCTGHSSVMSSLPVSNSPGSVPRRPASSVEREKRMRTNTSNPRLRVGDRSKKTREGSANSARMGHASVGTCRDVSGSPRSLEEEVENIVLHTSKVLELAEYDEKEREFQRGSDGDALPQQNGSDGSDAGVAFPKRVFDPSKRQWRLAGDWIPITQKEEAGGRKLRRAKSPIRIPKILSTQRKSNRQVLPSRRRSASVGTVMRSVKEAHKSLRLSGEVDSAAMSDDDTRFYDMRQMESSQTADTNRKLESDSTKGGDVSLQDTPNLMDGWTVYDALAEMERMGIPIECSENDDSNERPTSPPVQNQRLRITTVNSEYAKSQTYPKYLCVPSTISDRMLEDVFKFRSKGRIPVICWKDRNGFATLSRCSQPFVGVKGSRCAGDEKLINAIRQASSLGSREGSRVPSPEGDEVRGTVGRAGSPRKGGRVPHPGVEDPIMFIVDARPKAAALGNKAMGAGYEFGGGYEKCELEFMGIENIHEMRKSYQNFFNCIRHRHADDQWHSTLESTGWLNHLRIILKAAVHIAQLLRGGQPVLVHCSDGWDRTAQLVSMAELLLDPYYRTIRGFEVLIEKEWLSFGHKFAQRYGHQPGQKFSSSERSPVFLQFIDVVQQLLLQFPSEFEFNEKFLISILDNIPTCQFGTFLGNAEKERGDLNLKDVTVSLWTRMNSPGLIPEFTNTQYKNATRGYLKPSTSMSDIVLWRNYYFRWNKNQYPGQYDMPLSRELRMFLAKKEVDKKGRLSPLESHGAPVVHRFSPPGSDGEPASPEMSQDEDGADSPLARSDPSLQLGTQGERIIKVPSVKDFFRSPTTRQKAPLWIPDRWAEACAECRMPFTFSRRKHHCRSCGKIYCSRCTKHSIPIPQFGFLKPVRVCSHCHFEWMRKEAEP